MKPFLTANWTNLINITYAVNPDVLLPYLPKGVDLDVVDGNAFVSVVPFDFTDTKFLGVKIPYHINFPEINLRFYVHHAEKSGVIFLKEFISKFFIKTIANSFYHERYEIAGLKSSVASSLPVRQAGPPLLLKQKGEVHVKHEWKKNGKIFSVEVAAENSPAFPLRNSREYFLEERFFGFSKNGKGEPLIFHVEHRPWKIYPLKSFKIDFDYEFLMGKEWKLLNELSPACVMLLDGSFVKMFPHRMLFSVRSALRESVLLSDQDGRTPSYSGENKKAGEVIPRLSEIRG